MPAAGDASARHACWKLEVRGTPHPPVPFTPPLPGMRCLLRRCWRATFTSFFICTGGEKYCGCAGPSGAGGRSCGVFSAPSWRTPAPSWAGPAAWARPPPSPRPARPGGPAVKLGCRAPEFPAECYIPRVSIPGTAYTRSSRRTPRGTAVFHTFLNLGATLRLRNRR